MVVQQPVLGILSNASKPQQCPSKDTHYMWHMYFEIYMLHWIPIMLIIKGPQNYCGDYAVGIYEAGFLCPLQGRSFSTSAIASTK